MQSFIHRKNLELFRKKLAETTDEAERRALEELLAAEEGHAEAKKRPVPKQPNEI